MPEEGGLHTTYNFAHHNEHNAKFWCLRNKGSKDKEVLEYYNILTLSNLCMMK